MGVRAVPDLLKELLFILSTSVAGALFAVWLSRRAGIPPLGEILESIRKITEENEGENVGPPTGEDVRPVTEKEIRQMLEKALNEPDDKDDVDGKG